MQIVDVNVLLYAVNEDAPNHAAARVWLDGALSNGEPVGFTWQVMLAFLRLTTKTGLFPSPLTIDEATDVVQDWLGRPLAVVVEPTARHLPLLLGLLSESGTGGNLVSDAHLAALALEHGAGLVSFDADFGRFAGVRWTRPGG